MPRPLPDGYRYIQGPACLRRRPDLGVQIAIVAAAWAHVEDGLGHMLARMMKADPIPATAMFHELASLQARLSALTATAEIVLPEPLFKELIKDKGLLHEVRRCAKSRNNLVHAKWGLCDKLPDHLVLVPPFWKVRDKPQVYAMQDFIDIENRISALRRRIQSFNAHIENALQSTPPGSPQLSSPPQGDGSA